MEQALLAGPGTVWTSAFSTVVHLSKTGSWGMDHCIEAPLAVASTYIFWRHGDHCVAVSVSYAGHTLNHTT
jgi:hypothetical protein